MRQECPLHTGQEPAFKSNHAHGPRGAVIGNQHKTAIRPVLQRHLRNNRNSQSGPHHAQDAAELSRLKDDARQKPGPFAYLHGGLAEAMIVAQEQKRLFTQFIQQQGALFGKAVVFRKDGKQPFGA